MSKKGFTMLEALTLIIMTSLLAIMVYKYDKSLQVTTNDIRLYSICSTSDQNMISDMKASINGGAELKEGNSTRILEKTGFGDNYKTVRLKTDIQVVKTKAYSKPLYNIIIATKVIGTERVSSTTKVVIYRGIE